MVCHHRSVGPCLYSSPFAARATSSYAAASSLGVGVGRGVVELDIWGRAGISMRMPRILLDRQ